MAAAVLPAVAAAEVTVSVSAAAALMFDSSPPPPPAEHGRRADRRARPQLLVHNVDRRIEFSKARRSDRAENGGAAASEAAAGKVARGAALQWRGQVLPAHRRIRERLPDQMKTILAAAVAAVAANGGRRGGDQAAMQTQAVGFSTRHYSKTDFGASEVDGDERRASRDAASTASVGVEQPPPPRRQSTLLLLADGAAAAVSGPASRTRHRGSILPDGATNPRLKRKSRRPDLIRKFKAAAWISVLIKRLCAAHVRNSEDHESPYMKDVRFVESIAPSEEKPKLLFDVGLFKANREIRMSEDCKKILRLPRWARTESELLHVQISLRSIADYAAYPIATQREIAEVGQYLKYEPRRIIVREGHPAWNFYFIVSGAVVVVVLDDERKYAIPKAVLRRGQSFGELALLSGNPRISTVIAIEEVEMVGIWHEDYKRIFNNGGGSKSEDEFLKGLPFFSGWPLEVADDHPQEFRYHFYKQGEIIVKDSSNSKWIIVVKSGSLNVIKKLRHVDPFVANSRKRNDRLPARKWQRRLKPLLATKEHWSVGRQAREDTAVQMTSESKTGFSNLPVQEGDEQNSQERAKNAEDDDIRQQAASAASLSEEEMVKRTRKAVVELSEQRGTAGVVKQDIRTAAQELDKGYDAKFYGDSLLAQENRIVTEADVHPMFVHVRTLTKGHVFGINDVIFGEHPSFSLISNGAECILVDKNLYAKHLSEQLLKTLRVESQAYPGDEEMQTNLQISVNWEAYKNLVIRKVVEFNRKSHRPGRLRSLHRH